MDVISCTDSVSIIFSEKSGTNKVEKCLSKPQPFLRKTSLEEQISLLAEEIKASGDVKMGVGLVLDSRHSPVSFQSRVDDLINQLKQITIFLNIKIEMICKMNLLVNIITFKIFELQYEYKSKIDALKAEKEEVLLSKLDENMIPLELLNLDRMIREYERKHHDVITPFRKQKCNMQREYEALVQILDEKLELLTTTLETLKEEEEEFIKDGRGEPLLIDYIISAALEEYAEIRDNFVEKQITGWKLLESDEKMLEILNERGLTVTQSGHFLTCSGERISYDEAERRELLHGLDLRFRMFPKDLRRNDDILSRAGTFFSQVDSGKESLGTRMSSEDVAYLKVSLGKPLTLALAEITTKQPRDPIHYLGHWLFKYRYNQELDAVQKEEYDALMAERNRILREKLHKLYEEEARLIIFEMINNAENEAMRKELERIMREQLQAEEEADDREAAKEYNELKKLLNMIQMSGQQK